MKNIQSIRGNTWIITIKCNTADFLKGIMKTNESFKITLSIHESEGGIINISCDFEAGVKKKEVSTH